jgi:hypothetical protein
MANILHMAKTVDEEVSAPGMPAPETSPSPIFAFVVACRGSHNGRGHNPRGRRGGRGLPNACCSLEHILASRTAPDDALLTWTLAKRKTIVQKYGTLGGFAFAHAALLSNVSTDDADSLPTLEDCADEYDDTEVSVPFSFVAFSSSRTPSRDLSQFRVVDSACSMNLTAFIRSHFATFTPPSAPSRVGGVGADVKGSGSVRTSIRMAFGQTARSTHCTHPICHLALLNASGDY